MALPANVNRVLVTGTYTNADGTAAAGTLTFTPSFDVLRDPSAEVILVGVNPIIITLTAGGAIPANTYLIATDDPDLIPQGWHWEVKEVFTGARPTTWKLSVPVLAAEIKIAGQDRGTPTPITHTTYVTTADLLALRGTPSGIATLDSGGNVPVAQLGNASGGGGGGADFSLVNARGDLIVGTANDTVARKGAGTEGQALTVAEAEADGLLWKTLAAADVGGAELVHVHDADDVSTGTVAAARLPDATGAAKGVVALANHLGGTAAAPTVPGLAGKSDTGHTHSYLAPTLADAKGDLIVATAADTMVRKAVGTNGQAFTADSTQTDGLLWKTLTAADIANIPPKISSGTTLPASGVEGELFFLVD